MSYLSRRNAVTRMIQLNADGTQTGAADGDKVKFPTKTTSGGDGVSITSAGVISLNSARDYYITLNVDADRSNNTSDIAFEWYNESTNTKMAQSAGAFESRYLPLYSDRPAKNGNEFGQLIISQPSHDVSVRLNQMGSYTADINVGCHLFIVEVEK